MKILGIRIDLLTLDESMQSIRQTIWSGSKCWIISANPELIYRAKKEKTLQDMINSADLNLPDGVGVVWAARLYGAQKAERVTGIDLTLKILEEASRRNWRVFLLGAKPEINEKALANVRRKFPGIALAGYHGYFRREEEGAVLEKIEAFDPDILLVGMGAPKQEFWLAAYPGKARVRIGVGGTFDVLSGEIKRAPKFFSDHHLEWFYRLVTQPARIRRQIVLPLYVLSVLRERFFSR